MNEQHKSECKCIDCNLPDAGIEKLGYKPPKSSRATEENLTPIIEPKTKGKNSEVSGQPLCHQTMTGRECIGCSIDAAGKCPLDNKPGVPVLAADSDGKLLNETELRVLDKHIKQNYQKAFEQPEGLCKKTLSIVDACKLVVQSYEDHETDTMTTCITVVQACEQLNCLLENIKKEAHQGMVKMGFKATEQPNTRRKL